MSHRYVFQQTGPASGRILDGSLPIADIRDLQLCNVRFRPHGPVLIDDTVPVPLFWRQYHHHQDPERSAAGRGEVSVVQQEWDELLLRCTSTNESASIGSEYQLRLCYSEKHRSYLFRITALLTIPSGRRWLVTRNPDHGELEFCNLWPAQTFVTDPSLPKKYDACYVQRGAEVTAIPHHHLESADKHDIALAHGDRFLWALEDDNVVFEMMAGDAVAAGLCAYMWDAHFAYRCTTPEQPEIILQGFKEFAAEFALYAISRAGAADIVNRAVVGSSPEIADTPIYWPGLNSFNLSALDVQGQAAAVWPWSCESTAAADAKEICALDRRQGYSDSCSLRIHSPVPGRHRWLATTLGPAFGQAAFPDQARYRLTGYVKTEQVSTGSTLAVRLHRPGNGNLYNPNEYEHYYAMDMARDSRPWQKLTITTPRISPAPDRLHLLLEQNGSGTTWFDDVQLEILPDDN